MKQKQLKLITLFFLLGFGLTGIHAQEAITTAGGNAWGSGGTVSYSVGQVVYQTYTTTGGSVTEGVQLPYEISLVNGFDDTKGINLSVSVYPNPATDYLTLSINEFDNSDLYYQLYDLQGIIIQSGKIIDEKTKIEMSDLTPEMYFVRVIKQNTEIKTFRIIKN